MNNTEKIGQKEQRKLCVKCRTKNDIHLEVCTHCQTKLAFAVSIYPDKTIISNKYRITRILGFGTMGSVYEGEHLYLKRKVVLKFIHSHLLSKPSQRLRFHREAVTSSSVAHPNAIQIFDTDETEEGEPFLVIEFLEGFDMGQVVWSETPPSLVWIADIIHQTLNGLEAAHKKGIVHRALKPQNLFLIPTVEERHLVKIVDFGLARFFAGEENESGLTTDGIAVGTPIYMSPEQVRAQELDGRSDL